MFLVLTAAAAADEDIVVQVYDVADFDSAGIDVERIVREEFARGEWSPPHALHHRQGRLVIRHRALVQRRIEAYLLRLRTVEGARCSRVAVSIQDGLARTETIEQIRVILGCDRQESDRLVWRFIAWWPPLDRNANERLADEIRQEFVSPSAPPSARVVPCGGDGLAFVQRVDVADRITSTLLARVRIPAPPRPILPPDALDSWWAIEESLLERVTRAIWWQPHPDGWYEFTGRPQPYEISVRIDAAAPIERIEVDPAIQIEIAWDGPNRVEIEASPASGPFRVRYFVR